MARAQACPNCSQAGVKPVFTDAHGRVVECARCRLQFAAVYPDYDELDADVYSYGYFSEAISDAKNAQRERAFAALLGELESVLGRKGRLLDIGAGEGTLMRTAAARGWEVEGTDVSSAMVQYTREKLGFTLHHGAIEDLGLAPGSFDAVVLNHVLEHVQNPVVTLEHVARLLRADGVVRIEVPNLASLSSRMKNTQSRLRLKRSPWKHYSTDHHFWFFTPATLARTMQTARLRVLEMRAPRKGGQTAGLLQRLGNRVYRRTLWGGHLTAYARPARS